MVKKIAFHDKQKDDKSRCRRKDILYESTCIDCLKDGKDETYVGKCGKSAYERAKQHMEGYRGERTDSHIWNHALDKQSSLKTSNLDL